MKKIVCLLSVLIFTITSCGVNTYTTENTKPINTSTLSSDNNDDILTIKLSDTHPETHPSVQGDYEFKRLVEEKSEGKIIIEVYPNATLGPEKDVTEMVQNGDVEMQRAPITLLETYYPEYSILTMPYLYKSKEQMFDVLESDLCFNFLYPSGTANFIGLSWFDGGTRNIYTTQKQVSTLDDLKGLKIRVQQSQHMAELLESLGAIPVPVTYEDTYTMLKDGEIDGAENNYNSYISSHHNEVAKYYLEDNHVMLPELLIINKDVYNSLTPNEQVIISESAQQASIFQRNAYELSENQQKDYAISNGTIITKLSEEELSKFQEASSILYKNYTGDYLRLIDQILAYDNVSE